MTAVASPPSFANINRPAWVSGSQSLNGSVNHDDVRNMFASASRKPMQRAPMQRTNSSSSIDSNTSVSSASSSSTATNGTTSNGSHNGGPVGGPVGGGNVSSPASDANGMPITTLRKRPLQKVQWSGNKQVDGQTDFGRGAVNGRQQLGPGPNGVSSLNQLPPFVPGQVAQNGTNGTNGIMARPSTADGAPPQGQQPVLYLVSLNGSFERKTISVPFSPDTLRIGRQTNKSTTPNTVNGYFDSKVLSRQHAEIWADRQGKIWIRDIKSSNGTFVNGNRLSAENRESEPHELQTNDHLELGIDIVSEDSKSVVHHKVAAKVEHAGFINPSNSILDMNFGDLDPSNGAAMGSPMNGVPFRGRTGSQASMGPMGRMAPMSNMAVAQNNGMALQRGLWLTGPSTEAIVKKIQQEMRSAKQQSQDLQRTHEFIKALLSKDDIRNESHPKLDAAAAESTRAAQPPLANGSSLPFRADPKARFSDPPAPPPQQPLPEKPDVPSLKRATTERLKSGPPSNTSPIRHDAMGQVLQLTDALNNAKHELVSQHSRLHELEAELQREKDARRSAEEFARRIGTPPSFGDTSMSTSATNAAISRLMEGIPTAEDMNGFPDHDAAALEEAFEPPIAISPDDPSLFQTNAVDTDEDADKDGADAAFRARLDAMLMEMEGMRRQLQAFKERAEKAEAERDADRETLADMVRRIHQRDERDAKLAAEAAAAAAAAAAANPASDAALAARAGGTPRPFDEHKRTSLVNGKGGSYDGSTSATMAQELDLSVTNGKLTGGSGMRADGVAGSQAQSVLRSAATRGDELADDGGTLSRTNTITPSTALIKAAHNPALLQGMPYASMVGVVLIGMGLMAYLNGWQPTSARLDR